MKSPNLGNFEIEVYSFSSGQERFVGIEPIQKYLDKYWGFVKSADDPINYLVEFMTFKDSYMVYKLVPNIQVKQATELLQSGKMLEMKRFLLKSLQIDKDNIEFLKLLGIAYAQTNEPTRAREIFLRVLNVNPNNRITLLNYISACFQDCDGNAGLNTIELHLELFSDDEIECIADSLSEAILNNVINYDIFPAKLKEIFGLASELENES